MSSCSYDSRGLRVITSVTASGAPSIPAPTWHTVDGAEAPQMLGDDTKNYAHGPGDLCTALDELISSTGGPSFPNYRIYRQWG